MIKNGIVARLDQKIDLLRGKLETCFNSGQFGGALSVEQVEPNFGNIKSEIAATPICWGAKPPCFGDWQTASPLAYGFFPVTESHRKASKPLRTAEFIAVSVTALSSSAPSGPSTVRPQLPDGA